MWTAGIAPVCELVAAVASSGSSELLGGELWSQAASKKIRRVANTLIIFTLFFTFVLLAVSDVLTAKGNICWRERGK